MALQQPILNHVFKQKRQKSQFLLIQQAVFCPSHSFLLVFPIKMVCLDVVLSVSRQNIPYTFIIPHINGPKLACFDHNFFIPKKLQAFLAILEMRGFEFRLRTNQEVGSRCPWSEVNESDLTIIQTNMGASSVKNLELVAPVVQEL